MKTLFGCALVIFTVCLVGCESQLQEAAKEQGIDLGTWQRVGDDAWNISPDGATAGPAEAVGFLVSNDTYADFALSIEYWVEDETNSGVFVRCAQDDEIGPELCYELNIWDSHPNQDSRTGSLVTLAKPLAHIDGLERWVPVAIVVTGNRVTATYDGQVTADFEGDRSASGYIALQYGGTGRLQFRNLSIEAR